MSAATRVLVVGLISACFLTGCGDAGLVPSGQSLDQVVGSPEDSGQTATIAGAVPAEQGSDSGPEATVAAYLEACRAGDLSAVNRLLTSIARQKTQEMDIAVAPPGSETAQFEVLAHEFLDPEQLTSHVASRWTDVGANGTQESLDIIWVAKREENGWRIAGMIAQLFEDQPATAFNFEDPEDVIRRQQSADEELARRSSQADSGR